MSISHPPSRYVTIVSQTPNHKHLALILHAPLTFDEQLKVITAKMKKSIENFTKDCKNLGLNHEGDQQFKHNLEETLEPFCSCDCDVKANMRFS